MSWWDDDDDVLGDEPADRIKNAWRTLLARRREAGQPLPRTDEALESFAAALRGAPLEPAFSGFRLERGGEAVREYRGDAPVSEITALFAQALPAIADAYRHRFERAPRPQEMVKTLEFIVSPDPSRYFADAAAGDELRLYPL